MEYNTTPYGQLRYSFLADTAGAIISPSSELLLTVSFPLYIPSRRSNLFSITPDSYFTMNNVSLVNILCRVTLLSEGGNQGDVVRLSFQRLVNDSEVATTSSSFILNSGGSATSKTLFSFSDGNGDPFNTPEGFTIKIINDSSNKSITLTESTLVEFFTSDYGV